MKQKMNQSQLYQWVGQTSFAVTDILLYLDTHPDDKDAIAYFDYYNRERQKALKLYAEEYAPLTLNDVNEDSHWYWVTEPWPWEGGMC